MKNYHQNIIVFYNQEIHQKQSLHYEIESKMDNALLNQQFVMFLQPKISLKDGSLSGAEALVRWLLPEGGMYYPDQFIPLFEQNGFCVKLDCYMLEQACMTLQRWLTAGLKAVPLSINQSRILFYLDDYVEMVEQIMEGTETAEQVAFMKAIGCDIAQGYYFSRPVSVEELEQKYL